jgi:hypothetical protein
VKLRTRFGITRIKLGTRFAVIPTPECLVAMTGMSLDEARDTLDALYERHMRNMAAWRAARAKAARGRR